MKGRKSFLLAFWVLMAGQAPGASPSQDILRIYDAEARRLDPGFKGFSAARGQQLYRRREHAKGGEISCATCHSSDPRQDGRTRANRDIEPLAPSANPKRFTDPKKVEKWFARNCDDVLQRPCSPSEKGDFMTYLLSVK